MAYTSTHETKWLAFWALFPDWLPTVLLWICLPFLLIFIIYRVATAKNRRIKRHNYNMAVNSVAHTWHVRKHLEDKEHLRRGW